VSRFSLTELLREKEYRRARGESMVDIDAFEYFCRNYVFIQHPERGAILFDLRPMQLDIMRVWMTERYSLVLKARQIGWSTLVAVYALWLTFFWSDQQIVMLSKEEKAAIKLLEKANYAYKRLPAWMKERGPKRLTHNVKDITFDNGSQIDSLPSKEDPARSRTVSLVIVDEWAFLDNAEEAWASIEPITDIGGRAIGLSTANGWGDWFHTEWIKANAGISPFKPMFFPWSAVTERDDDWYEAKKASMLEWQLHQEYPTTPEEAFIKSGRPVFDVEKLTSLHVTEPERGFLDTLLEDGSRSIRAPRFRPKKGGAELAIWQRPEIGHGYVIGADVAEGLEHGDYSSAHVIDVKTGAVVAIFHAHVDPDVFGERLAELGWFYNRALIGVEVNNHGLTTNKTLQRLSYPRVYYRRTLDQRTREQRLQVGWRTDVASKPLMVDELARSLREDSITLEDAFTIQELTTFVRDEKGKMSGSPFDDRVISLAIAVQMVNHGYTPSADMHQEDDYWTFDYFVRKVTTPEGAETPIGSHNVR
jgi:hypothetical protein